MEAQYLIGWVRKEDFPPAGRYDQFPDVGLAVECIRKKHPKAQFVEPDDPILRVKYQLGGLWKQMGIRIAHEEGDPVAFLRRVEENGGAIKGDWGAFPGELEV